MQMFYAHNMFWRVYEF